MKDYTVAQLGALGGRDYIEQIKARLTDDEAWQIMAHPALVEYTRWGLNKMLESIDAQFLRSSQNDDERWLRRMESLRRMCQDRLNQILPNRPSNNRETKAWKAFSARLAGVIAEIDPEALEALKAPYGGVSARQWLDSRGAKRA